MEEKIRHLTQSEVLDKPSRGNNKNNASVMHTTTLQRTTQRCTTQAFHNAIHIPFLQRHRCDALPCFSASPVEFFLHRTHRPSAFASIFPFATMVYCTKQQEICQESQRSDVATGNARWPTQTQTQRCGALSASRDVGGLLIFTVPPRHPVVFSTQGFREELFYLKNIT